MHTVNFFLSTPDLMFLGAFASFLLAWCPLSSGLGFGVGGSGCLGTGVTGELCLFPLPLLGRGALLQLSPVGAVGGTQGRGTCLVSDGDIPETARGDGDIAQGHSYPGCCCSCQLQQIRWRK